MRESSLPAIWSCVTSTARAPRSSAAATPIGPPIGSNTTIVPSDGSSVVPDAHVDALDDKDLEKESVKVRKPAPKKK